MFPPVTAVRHSFQITPHSTCSAVWVRISAWRRSQSISPWTVVADGRERRAVAEHVPHIVTRLGDVDHRRPGQRPRVVGLSATGRVEGGPVEGHPPLVRIDRQDRAVEVAEEGIPQVQQLSRHGPIMARDPTLVAPRIR